MTQPLPIFYLKSFSGHKGRKGIPGGGGSLPRNAPQTVKENMAHGIVAMQHAIAGQKTVRHAMWRVDIGWIDFRWGAVGEPPTANGRRKGAKGIVHIIEARRRKDGHDDKQMARVLIEIIGTVANGEIANAVHVNDDKRITLRWRDHEAILIKSKRRNAWLLTGWKIR